WWERPDAVSTPSRPWRGSESVTCRRIWCGVQERIFARGTSTSPIHRVPFSPNAAPVITTSPPVWMLSELTALTTGTGFGKRPEPTRLAVRLLHWDGETLRPHGDALDREVCGEAPRRLRLALQEGEKGPRVILE